MINIKKLLMDLENEPFSIETIERCKDYFHYAKSSKEEQQLVKEFLQEKIKKYFEMGSENIAAVLTEHIKCGGVTTIKDVLFFEDAIYVEETWHLVEESKTIFIGSLNDNFCFEVSDYGIGLLENIKDFNAKARIEKFVTTFNQISKKIYNFPIFPEVFSYEEMYKTDYSEHDFATDKEIKDLYPEILNGQNTAFRIIDRNQEDNEYYLMEIETNQSGEAILKSATKIQFTRLSELIENKEDEKNQMLLNLTK